MSIELSYVMMIAGALVGALVGALKWFGARLLADMDKRLRRIDEIEERLDRMAQELPLHYQRRDDAIREYTAINAKLDRLYELMMRDRQ